MKIIDLFPPPRGGTVLQASAMDCDFTRWKAPLVICHPPYFNVYKYSGIFSLEMAWLGYEIQAIRRLEIREFFKVGKPEKVAHYVHDLSRALRNIARHRAGRSLGTDDGRYDDSRGADPHHETRSGGGPR